MKFIKVFLLILTFFISGATLASATDGGDTVTVTVTPCATNTTWNGTICAPITNIVFTSAGTGGSISPTSATVNYGSSTSFTINPTTGYSINAVSGCSGSLSGSTYTTGAITASCTVSASFNRINYTLTVNKGGNGGGTVTGAGTYNYGTVVTATATPDANSTFSGWGGGGCSGTGTCTVTMNSNTTITAYFAARTNITSLYVSPSTIPYGGTANIYYACSNGYYTHLITDENWNWEDSGVYSSRSPSIIPSSAAVMNTPGSHYAMAYCYNSDWVPSYNSWLRTGTFDVVPPAPTNLSQSCSTNGRSATMSWAQTGVSLSYFRIVDDTTGVQLPYSIPENISDTGPSTTISTTPGHAYHYWVHGRLPNGNNGPSSGASFTCNPTSNLTIVSPGSISGTYTTGTLSGAGTYAVDSGGGANIIIGGWANYTASATGCTSTSGGGYQANLTCTISGMTSAKTVTVTYTNTPPPMSTPIYPANGSTVNNGGAITFTTNAVTDAEGQTVQYYFRVATGTDAETGQVCNSGWITSTSYTCNPGVGTLYWHVYTYDGIAQTNPNYVWSFYNNAQPHTQSVSPSSGSITGGAKTFTSVYTDPNGATDINYVHLLMNYGVDGNNSAFYGYYVRSSNSCYIYGSDGNQTWNAAPYTGLAWIDLVSCSSVASGNTLTVTWNTNIKSWPRSSVNAYLYVVDNSGWSWGWDGPYATYNISYPVTISSPGGISGTYSAPGTYDVPSTNTVSVTAAAWAGYTVAISGAGCNGSGGDSQSASCTSSPITSAQTIAVTYAVQTRTLTVNQNGNGTGTVTGAGTYSYNATAAPTASAGTGSTFTGWSGDCSGGASPTYVNMNANKTCTATFTLNPEVLTINKGGNGGGTVTGPGINCGADCSETYNYGTVVTLTATPDANSSFSSWSGGGCSSDASASPVTCLVTMDTAKSVTANFALYAVTNCPTVSPNPVAYGGSTNISFTSTNGYYCHMLMDWDWNYNYTGYFDHATWTTGSIAPMSNPGTHTVSTICYNSDWLIKGDWCSTNFTVAGLTNPNLTVTTNYVTNSHGPTETYTGGPVTLNWGAVANATSCTLSGGILGTITVSTAGGSQATTASALNQTYTLSCTNSTSQSASDQVIVTTPPPPTNLVASCSGDSLTATMSWTGPSGYNTFYTRASVGPWNGSNSTGYPGWDDNHTGTSVSFPISPNTDYSFWVHTRNPNGASSNAIGDSNGTVIRCNRTQTLRIVSPGRILLPDYSVTTTPVDVTYTLPYGATPTVTAEGWLGYYASISGGCTAGPGAESANVSCTVPAMSSNQTVTVTYAVQSRPLTVTKVDPSGTATITASPAGSPTLSCGATCSSSYNFNTAVTVNAPAVTNYTATISGGCTAGPSTVSTGTSCVVTMNAAKAVTVTYTRPINSLEIISPGKLKSPDYVANTPPVDLTYQVNYGSNASITAEGWAGYTASMSGGCTASGTYQADLTCTISNMTSAKVVTIAYTLRQFTATATNSVNGVVTAPLAKTVNYNTPAVFTITPNTGYTTTTPVGGTCGGTLVGTTYTTVNMTADCAITPVYTINQYMLTLNASTGTGAGSYTGTSAGNINYGTAVTVTASPATSSNFVSWVATGAAASCNGSTTAACSFTMTGVASLTANYILKTYSLRIVSPGNILSPDYAISGPNVDVTYQINYNATPKVTAEGWLGYYASIGGGCTAGPGAESANVSCTLPAMTANQTETVTYAVQGRTLTVSKAGTGTGTVTSNPGTISCGVTCGPQNFNYGTVVNLTATPIVTIPTSGSVFAGWSGDADCTDGSVTLNVNKNCIATFNLMSGTLAPSSGTSCLIDNNSGVCNLNLNWGITNPIATPTAITGAGTANINVTNTLASSQSGTQSVIVPYGGTNFFLYNNSIGLAGPIATTATCSQTPNESYWDSVNSQCKANSATGNIHSVDCRIPLNSNVCPTKLNWDTINPIDGFTSIISLAGVTVTTGNSMAINPGYSKSIYYGSNIFTLTHAGKTLSSVTASANCLQTPSQPAYWNDGSQKCLASGICADNEIVNTSGVCEACVPPLVADKDTNECVVKKVCVSPKVRVPFDNSCQDKNLCVSPQVYVTYTNKCETKIDCTDPLLPIRDVYTNTCITIADCNPPRTVKPNNTCSSSSTFIYTEN
jgi:membrane-bound inhibitor of C-type lysozyme